MSKVICERIASEGDFDDGTVRSSHGEFQIKRTGHVIDFDEESDEFDEMEALSHLRLITRFNLVEYLRTYPDEEFPDEFDILDLGYWYSEKDENGEPQQKYVPPDYTFRREVVGIYKTKEG